LPIGEQLGVESRHNQQAELRKAVRFLADERYRLAGLLALRQLGIVLVSDAEIVPDDVALLDIDA
jgi:hypothetical protein